VEGSVMKVKRYSATTMQQGLRMVREDLGADAVILSSRKTDGMVEIMAALNYDEQLLRSSAPEPDRNKSAGELARMETDKQRRLQHELEKSRQRIAAVKHVARWPEAQSPARKAVPAQVVAAKMQATESPVTAGASKAGREVEKRRNSVAAQQVATPLQLGGTAKDALTAMHSEIMQLKCMLTQQLQSQVQQAQANEVQRELEDRLSRMGVFPELQKKLLGRISATSDMQTAWRYVLAQLTRALKTTEDELIERGGIFALLGQTGAGKTTTIGKLAARYVMRHGTRGVALVTTDRYRIAAHEQLVALGRILGIPVRVVDEKNPLDAILDTLRGKKLVLIDTAGLNQQDKSWSLQLSEIKSSRHHIDSFLVIAAINQSQVMRSTYHSYKMVGLAGCIITKLDEALTLGEAVSLAAVNSLPVAYVTDGQKIPDDIQPGRANKLINRALSALHQVDSAAESTKNRRLHERELVV
jgi:flagellar biosynthesis protein FlhF